jgi:hypothetical protein
MLCLCFYLPISHLSFCLLLHFLIYLTVVLLTLVTQCFLVEVVLMESFLLVLVIGVGVPKE